MNLFISVNRVFHDKTYLTENLTEDLPDKKLWKNKFTKKLPPVGFDLPTATFTALKSDT